MNRSLIVAALLLVAGCGREPDHYKLDPETEKLVQEGKWQRSPLGPTDYTRRQQNMGQSGVNDIQIPFKERVKFADDHGLRRPER